MLIKLRFTKLVIDGDAGIDWNHCGWFSFEKDEENKVEAIKFISGEAVDPPQVMSYFNDFVIEKNWWPTAATAKSPSSGCSVNLMELFDGEKAAALSVLINV